MGQVSWVEICLVWVKNHTWLLHRAAQAMGATCPSVSSWMGKVPPCPLKQQVRAAMLYFGLKRAKKGSGEKEEGETASGSMLMLGNSKV